MEWEKEAAEARLEMRHRDLKQHAWLVALLTRAKRLPELKRFLDVTPKQQDWREMKAALMAITNGEPTDDGGTGTTRTRRRDGADGG